MKDVPFAMQQQMPVQKTAGTLQLQVSNKVLMKCPSLCKDRYAMVQTVQKTMKIPQPECIVMVVDDPVVQVPQIRVMEKTVEGQQSCRLLDNSLRPPETQMIQSARTSERSGTTPVCQETQAEIREVNEIGASIPAESASPIFVTAPVLENSPVVVVSATTSSCCGVRGARTHGLVYRCRRDACNTTCPSDHNGSGAQTSR